MNKTQFHDEYYWLTPQSLVDTIILGEKAKSDLLKLIQIFYLDKPVGHDD